MPRFRRSMSQYASVPTSGEESGREGIPGSGGVTGVFVREAKPYPAVRADEFRVLGVDTSVRNTGLGVVAMRGSVPVGLWHDTVHIPANRPLTTCLVTLQRAVAEAIGEMSPAAVAVEGIFCGRFVKTATLLGHARGVVLAAAAAAGLPVYEYEPTRVKQAVVGTGGAVKVQMQSMMRSLLHLSELPAEDEADALAIALCHLHSMGSFQLRPPKML